MEAPADGRRRDNQPNERCSTRSKAGRRETTQQPATLEGHVKRRMRKKRQQLDKRGGCLLRGGSTATEGGGSMSVEVLADGRQCNNQPNERGTTIGGASGREAMQEPAKYEWLNKRQRHNKSYLRVGVPADYRQQLNRRRRHCQSRGGVGNSTQEAEGRICAVEAGTSRGSGTDLLPRDHC